MSGVSYEFSAKTVDAAITEGLRHLGVRQDEVAIEVLHEGSRGLLGIGSTNARVRITIPPQPRPGVANAAEPGIESVAEEAAMHAPEEQTAAEETSGVEATDPALAAEHDRVGQAEASVDAEPSIVDETTAGLTTTEAVAEPDQGEAGAAQVDTGEYDEEDEAYDYGDLEPDELSGLATELLSELITHMGFTVEIETSWPEGQGANAPLDLNVVGDDLGMLIGRHGETLASIQYLVRLMVNQRIHRWTNIVVDVDGYKARRAEQLNQMAQRMADQVVRTGRPVALEPMPANERRLVHIALRSHPQVYTESTGEADRRKVQILPK